MSRTQLIHLLIFLATITFVVGGTIVMVRYAKGYRPTRSGSIKGTGLLSANSFPTGAEVYINGKLTTATDNTLNLDPADYQIEIKKDGYHTWNKTVKIEAELVTQTNAQLFPTSPSLEPLTYTGAQNSVPSPDGNKLAFAVASASAAAKNGLYVQDLTSGPISLNKSARQIARTSAEYDYATATYTWSPNGSELLVAFPSGAHILLDATRFNDVGSIKDVTATLSQIWSEWELELAREERTQVTKLPEFFQNLATDSAKLGNTYFSPDGKKLLYQAIIPLDIPTELTPSLPATSSQPEVRTLVPGKWYVYDLEEDKNFEVAVDSPTTAPASPTPTPKTTKKLVPTPSAHPIFTPSKLSLLTSLSPIPAELGTSTSAYHRLQTDVTREESIRLFNAQYSPIFVTGVQWYPDSSHLIFTTAKGIEIGEYDGTNRVTIYAGPMDNAFVYPWPDGSRIITRIQFSPDTIPNLYTIKVK
jgi:hypothetical protein